MKAFGKYISKYLFSYFGLMLLILGANVLSFILLFGGIVSNEYGKASPSNVLASLSSEFSNNTISEETKSLLKKNEIWVMFLNEKGTCTGEYDLPDEIAKQYTIQDVAVFSKGYLQDYPVFVQKMDQGLIVLGYPKNSFMKLSVNYFPLRAVKRFPLFLILFLAIDSFLLFLVFTLSRKKISKQIGPIIKGVQSLSKGQRVSIHLKGDLGDIAESINKTSMLIQRQNQARLNWIRGISHDIRTPLSMIIVYSERIASNPESNEQNQKEAKIICAQSIKIKKLIQDLNLTSRLEYDTYLIHQECVSLSKIIRSSVAQLLNQGIDGKYDFQIEIMEPIENDHIIGDARLLERAINNLIYNSIQNNPQGCMITIKLYTKLKDLILIVEDNGIGLTKEKRQRLQETPHYIDSLDDRLDLRHGLGLVLVRQIIDAHKGLMQVESEYQKGYRTTLIFPLDIPLEERKR